MHMSGAVFRAWRNMVGAMRVRHTISIPLMAVGFILLLPVIIPVAGLQNAVYKRRLLKAANAFACVNCGRILGPDALCRADEVWSEHVRELMRQNPGMRFRMIRTVHAICPGCGTRYTFREKERTFSVDRSEVI
jgi:predicted RNA-binding Zn-ribbon protein involved in translation (DUF1610 family)